VKNRREILIEHMEKLEAQGMGCLGCSWVCCTFEANSMLLTPLEARELFDYLQNSGLLNETLKTTLQENIKQYRLEAKFSNARRSYLRKTYTCPFFNHKELGCPLPREVKPYGCLAFDSHHKEFKASEHCYSEKDLLELREKNHLFEKELNETIKNDFKLLWEKAPIPVALLDIWEKTTSSDL
jgi:hypothetical protein